MCCAVIYCLFAAGIVFGYAAIKPVLIDEGVFKDLCTEEELKKGISPCYGQELRLNFMFTLSAVSTNVAALPVGTILDRYGPRVCSLMGSLFLTIGTLLFSFASQMPGDGYTPGYFFFGLGGASVFISTFQLSNTFPQRSGLILALLTASFDSSSALFLVFRLIYQATGGKATTQRLFLAYLIVPIFIFTVQLFIMPKESYKTIAEVVKEAEEEVNAPTPPDLTEAERIVYSGRRESVMSEVTALLDKPANANRAARENNKNRKSGVWGAMHGHTALEQIRSAWFWLITFFTVVQMLRINYFVATIFPQERYLLNSERKARMINDFFDIALPAGGVLSIPFVGLILDNTSTPFALGALVITATVIGILGCLPFVWAAIANVTLFVLFRPFYYTTVSDYSAKVFGFVTFGKVYGLIICLAGLFNFMQSPLDAATHRVFDGNPIPINILLLCVAVLVGACLVAFTWLRSRTMARDKLEDEAEGASEALMPNADSDLHESSNGGVTGGTYGT